MAVVKCVMMQRDEMLLLEPWLRYYGYLFGFENLTIFDNGSVLEPVIETLKRFERCGVTIYWNFAGRENFEGKGFHFTNIIKGWDFGGQYDFAVPVDCDEFIAVLQRDGISCRRSDIHRTFDSLIGERRALGIEFSMFNIPKRAGHYRPQYYPKGFFACGTVKSLDAGFHVPAAQEAGLRDTDFTYLHYHNKPFPLALSHARRKLAGRVELDDPIKLASYLGPGNHLTKILGLDETQYLAQFDSSLILRFLHLEHLLRALGTLDDDLFPVITAADNSRSFAEATFVRCSTLLNQQDEYVQFAEQKYYRLHPDVQEHRIDALRHYIRHGFNEGRQVGDMPMLAP